MKEFDKIYVAKYSDIIGAWQIGRDLEVKTEQVEQVLENLKQTGLYDIYRKMPDEEWENLEKKKDSYILKLYMPKVQRNYAKIFSEIVEDLREQIPDYRHFFQEYKTIDYELSFDYFQEENLEGEEWRQIGKLNYEISNYGRIKNIQTKKLKALKKQRFGMQVLLWQNSQSYTVTISRMVASMFIRKVEDYERVSHINGNIRDNYYKNLRIVNK